MRLPACVTSWPARHAIAIRWKRRSERLKQQLDATRRAGFRQAAPFAKDCPQGRGGRPGRRAGTTYGRRGRRPIPARVDETYAAPLPVACPRCGGAIHFTRVATQYQEDLPVVQPIVRRFNIQIGYCVACRHRVQGRPPAANLRRLGRGRRAARSWRRDVYGPVAQTRWRAAGEDRDTAAGPVRADGHAGRTCSNLASRGPGSGAHVRGSLRSDPGESRRQSG